MSNWLDKNIFKKCIVFQTRNSEINIPQITHSSNWDSSKLIFLSSISELKVLEGISISKIEKKTNDLVYNIGYLKYEYNLISKYVNIPLFNNKLVIENSLYSIVWVRCLIWNKNSSISFKIYRNGIYIKDFTYKWDLVGQIIGSWELRFPIILNHPSIKHSEYTFSLISNNNVSDIVIEYIKNYSVQQYNVQNLKTNILFGEIKN